MKRLVILLIIFSIILSGCSLLKKDEPPAEENNNKTDTEIVLYFADSQALYVTPEKRLVYIAEDIDQIEYAKVVLEELIKGPDSETLYPTIPPETKVLDIDIDDSLIYIDFSKEIETKHWGGAAGERMTLLSLANTMTEIEGIKKVLPSVEGAALNIEHVILEEPLTRDAGEIYE